MKIIKTVTVTGPYAVLKQGTIAKIVNTGKGFWGVLESNGHRVAGRMTLFLIEGRDFK